ncbi:MULTISPECIES: glycoside hydrolase family 108 protein, partial [unclassified Campylobacter]|uniref:glycoside hydrolase family 108 protein n=1 Tax=unclassified Campylobacter TaxID=2593542 RepID=UPI003D328481
KMANFNKSYELMLGFEFNNPKNALHKNPTENGLTFMGIYEKAHPNWQGWEVVRATLYTTQDIAQASTLLYKDAQTRALVAKFYREQFWNAMRGDEIISQHCANEIFCFAVNAGVKQAIKTAQRVVGVVDDGYFGGQTLRALNSYDEAKFNKEYDRLELAYYNRLIEKNQKLAVYKKGWGRRATEI